MDATNPMYVEQVNSTLPQTYSFTESVGGALTLILMLFGFICLVRLFFILTEGRRGVKSKIDRKSLKGMRQLAIKQKLEAELTQSSKAITRYKYELLASQSGVRITYGEYRLLCISCALVLPLLTFLFLDNGLLALVMIFIGFIIPGQVMTTIRNRRIRILDRQVESFMELFVERYKLTQSPSIALEGCIQDLVGQQPLYSELQQALSELDTGDPVLEVFQRFSERTGNKYLMRMSTSLKMAEDIGTSDAREMLLTKSLQQYRNNKTLRNTLKERIEGPKRESMILLLAVPGVVAYQCFTSDTYVEFMLRNPIGKGGCVFVLVSCIGCIWFINKKIGAPIE